LSKPLRFLGNSWKAIVALVRRNPHICRDFGARWRREQLLAMQKVEGSNPFSRFRKTRVLQVFFVAAVALFLCIRSD
jgi:hypothetical protein